VREAAGGRLAGRVAARGRRVALGAWRRGLRAACGIADKVCGEAGEGACGSFFLPVILFLRAGGFVACARNEIFRGGRCYFGHMLHRHEILRTNFFLI